MIGRLRRVAFLLGLIAIWEAASSLAGPEPAIPAPHSVLYALLHGVQEGWLFSSVATSLRRLIMGFSAAVALGLSLGLVLGRVRLASEALGLAVLALQSVPSACWIPIALLLFGPSESAVIFMVVVYPLFFVAVTTENAVRAVSPVLLRAGQNLGARGVRFYTHVLFPAALPGILAGLRTGWNTSWRALMAGELLAGSGGLGARLIAGEKRGDIAEVFAVTVVVALISVTTDRLVIGKLESRVGERWGYNHH
jgi:NitT/TauT family transport system permease protein